jgi:Glycosyltransferase
MLNPMLPTQEPAKTPKEKIVLYAGRFQRCHKRIDRLLKIWKRIEQQNPEWRLVIVGDGEERGDLEKQARRLKLQRIEFAGYQYDVTPFYRRATFVCLTSNFEGLPMCLMEGQQYGAIPVSFDSYSGIREITCDGECGIMVPAYSLRKYAELLNRALADEELQKRMRENCYKAAERYDLECIGQEWLALFGKL